MNPLYLSDPEYDLWGLLARTQETIEKARDKDLAEIGITRRQAVALLAIYKSGESATPAEISRRLYREPHSVGVLLKRMERDGLVTRTRDLERRNLVRICLTARGRQALERSMERESLHRIFSRLSHGERQQLRSLLGTLLTQAIEELEARHHQRLYQFLERILRGAAVE